MPPAIDWSTTPDRLAELQSMPGVIGVMPERSITPNLNKAVTLSNAPAAWAQAAAKTKTKVVFQVSDADPAKWNLALNNVKNVQTDLGAGNVEIELVAYDSSVPGERNVYED